MKQLTQYNHAVLEALVEGQGKALELFHEASKRVPAYKKFLKEHDIRPGSVKTFDDFTKLPTIDKDNYLRKYPLEELLWDGNMFSGNLISVSSGSSGKPFYWLRGPEQQREAAEIYTRIYKEIFQCDQKKTLLVVCFSMGTWIAGSYTTLGGMDAANNGLKINVITPALELRDGLNSIKELSSNYEQVILAGYPPFIKDLLDVGEAEGVNWKKMHLGFTVAGEAITEELRDYFMEKSGDRDPTRIINIYGTADAGIVAHETPITVLLRRALSADYARTEAFFHKPVLPTIAHYDPRMRYFEEQDDNLIFTAPSGIPLIRYNIKDSGGIITVLNPILAEGIEAPFEKALDASRHSLREWRQPILYVHGRADFTATLYAVLIYPENIKSALLHDPLSKLTTGKFVMETKDDPKLNQYLKLTIELRPDVAPTKELEKLFMQQIVATLLERNAEYRKLSSAINERALPHIDLRAYGDEETFPRGNKHRWVPKRK